MLISFVLPAYKARFLKEAIEGILAQTYENFELIIVDDCSPEDLISIVGQFNDNRIKYYRNSMNIGGDSLVKQWNHCIQYANGDYIVLAADDDRYDKRFLEECITLARKFPSVDLIRARVKLINEQNELIGLDGILPEYCSKYAYLYYWLQATAFTCIGNYMFRSSVLKEKKFIDFPSAFGSDTASCVNMAENGVSNTSDMLFDFRISTIHLSSNKGKLDDKLSANTMLFKWFRKLNYEEPKDPFDLFFFKHTQWDNLYAKCKFDYYNLVIRYLPITQIAWINKCELLTRRDKLLMKIRFFKDKLI